MLQNPGETTGGICQHNMVPPHSKQHSQLGDGTTQGGQICNWWFTSYRQRQWYASTSEITDPTGKESSEQSHHDVSDSQQPACFTNNIPDSNLGNSKRPSPSLLTSIYQDRSISAREFFTISEIFSKIGRSSLNRENYYALFVSHSRNCLLNPDPSHYSTLGHDTDRYSTVESLICVKLWPSVFLMKGSYHGSIYLLYFFCQRLKHTLT